MVASASSRSWGSKDSSQEGTRSGPWAQEAPVAPALSSEHLQTVTKRFPCPSAQPEAPRWTGADVPAGPRAQLCPPRASPSCPLGQSSSSSAPRAGREQHSRWAALGSHRGVRCPGGRPRFLQLSRYQELPGRGVGAEQHAWVAQHQDTPQLGDPWSSFVIFLPHIFK